MLGGRRAPYGGLWDDGVHGPGKNKDAQQTSCAERDIAARAGASEGPLSVRAQYAAIAGPQHE